MQNQTKVQIHNSVSFQLLKIVFSFYIAVAISVTLIHMFAEYVRTKQEIIEDLELFHQTFENGIAHALWNVDEEQLQDIVKGMLKLPSIKGITIQDETSLFFQIGETSNELGERWISNDGKKQHPIQQKLVYALFQKSFPLIYRESPSFEKNVGRITLYSSTDIVIDKIKYGFLFILVNSILKTAALWLIFIGCAHYVLGRPLSKLALAAEQLRMENLENVQINIGIIKRNELKILEEAFNDMIRNLVQARESLKSMERAKLELETAQIVQQFIIPRQVPQCPNLDLATFYQSASETGGDWYDFRHHPEQQMLDVLIGDVSGHGLPAALVTAMTSGFCQAFVENQPVSSLNEPDSALDLFRNLNAYVLNTTQGHYTMTLFFSRIDLKNKVFHWISAAHCPLYLWCPAQESEATLNGTSLVTLRQRSYSIGAGANANWQVKTHPLQEGSILLWYTDGLTENTNSNAEMFGTRRLKQILKSSGNRTAAQIKEHILEAAFAHYGGEKWKDDITIIVARIGSQVTIA
ncbi:SpoIIE family protein phosphatase [Deltaproteobacteria bacterium TL4]